MQVLYNMNMGTTFGQKPYGFPSKRSGNRCVPFDTFGEMCYTRNTTLVGTDSRLVTA